MSRMRRQTLPLLLSLLLPALPLSAQDFNITILMQRLAAEEHPSRHFTEERQSELLFAPITLHGTLAYTEGRLIKHIKEPFDERFTIEDETLLIEREGNDEPQRIAHADYPQIFTFVTIFQASLLGDLTTLQRHYQTKLSGRSEAWQLQLTPIDADIAFYLKTVEIKGNLRGITHFIIDEQNGDLTTLELGGITQ